MLNKILSFKNYLSESLKTESDKPIDSSDHLEESDDDVNKVHAIHQHPDIKPNNFTQANINSLFHFTDTHNSRKINKYLEKLHNNKKTKDSNETELRYRINEISSVFSPENTNRKSIITYSGIPKYVGEKLLKSENNSKHTFPRFISTTTTLKKAMDFADYHANSNKDGYHVLKLYNKPGSALSMVRTTYYPNENEFLINKGSHIHYHYTTKEKIPWKGKNKTTYIHHVTVENTNTPISEYGKTT